MTASGPVNQSSPKRRVFLVKEGAAKFPPLAGLGGSRVSEKKGGRHDELSFWGTGESETLLHLGVSGVVPRRAVPHSLLGWCEGVQCRKGDAASPQ
ncbi:hypothetical protein RP20_CCG002212 [Aedes albopictus]|nr:hypothetical protein RP20_CCG002212 [Aedes albopictus]